MLRICLLAFGLTGCVALLSAPVALAGGDHGPAGALAVSAVVLIGCAFLVRSGVDLGGRTIAYRLAAVAAMWLAFSVSSAAVTWIIVQFYPLPGEASALSSVIPAMFESVSGTTTTGLSVVEDPAVLPAWLQWWRTMLQFAGALGVVLFAVVVAEPSGDRDSFVSRHWSNAPGDESLAAVKRIAIIFSVIAIGAIVLLMASGDPVWRAINHGITATATGGFAITSDSAGTSGRMAQGVLAGAALVSALSYGTLWDVASRRGAPIWKRTQVRWGLSLTALGAATVVLLRENFALGDVLFNAVSASSTAGFAAGSAHQTVTGVAAVTMISMLIGGAAGSTAGGIKVARIVWLAKSTARWMPGRRAAIEDSNYRWDGDHVDPEEARARILGAGAVVAAWLFVLSVGTVALAALSPDNALRAVAFETISAMSGVGLSSGLTGPDMGYGPMALLSVLMLTGRVEVTAFIILLLLPLPTVTQKHLNDEDPEPS